MYNSTHPRNRTHLTDPIIKVTIKYLLINKNLYKGRNYSMRYRLISLIIITRSRCYYKKQVI